MTRPAAIARKPAPLKTLGDSDGLATPRARKAPPGEGRGRGLRLGGLHANLSLLEETRWAARPVAARQRRPVSLSQRVSGLLAIYATGESGTAIRDTSPAPSYWRS